MTWRVEFRPTARSELLRLDRPVQERVLAGLNRLKLAPRTAANVKPLHDGTFRFRVGDWRVIYTLEDDLLVMLVLRVGHRREVYR